MLWHTSYAHKLFIFHAKELNIFLIVMDAFGILENLSFLRNLFSQVFIFFIYFLEFFFNFLSQNSLLSDCHIPFPIAGIAMLVNHAILDFFIFDLFFKALTTDFMHTIEEHVFDYILMLAALHFIYLVNLQAMII